MSLHIALLRGVNVAGAGPVTAQALSELLETLGLTSPRSGPGAGDLVFESPERTGAELQALLESELHGRLGLRTDVYVRTAEAWRAMIAANGFADFAETDPGWLTAIFLKDAADRKAVGVLRAAARNQEQVRAESRQLYIAYPNGPARSKLNNALIEKTLGGRVTSRPWTSVLALADMLDS
ncbi:MAG: DUF1697 domain-containing protein [Caulobacter sp.]|nr:DUF1697 domain-containing protein [Caulobacter sp.]